MHTRKPCVALLHGLLAFGLAGALADARAQVATSSASSAVNDLDVPGVVTLQPGAEFQLSIPLRPSRAVNLGAARLDVTLAPSGKGKRTDPELHLIAGLTAVQTSVSAGAVRLKLHGVVPDFPASRNGEYHPSDYSIHLGSGNVTNIGTPDDTLIDTEGLTKKLQDLRVRLQASTPK